MPYYYTNRTNKVFSSVQFWVLYTWSDVGYSFFSSKGGRKEKNKEFLVILRKSKEILKCAQEQFSTKILGKNEETRISTHRVCSFIHKQQPSTHGQHFIKMVKTYFNKLHISWSSLWPNFSKYFLAVSVSIARVPAVPAGTVIVCDEGSVEKCLY